jgi:transposase
MEDVLDLYAEAYDATQPKVCFDERPCQLLGDEIAPLPPEPGHAKRVDYHYVRQGVCNAFLMLEPLTGWRAIDITAQRTKADFAIQMKTLVDRHFPQAQMIHVVLDNLNTHTPAALYEVFEPAEARRILKKLTFHHTPKHGSWLNMAEIEFSVLVRQCLKRRIGDITRLKSEVDAYVAQRNAAKATVRWQFDVQQARTKLGRLYP